MNILEGDRREGRGGKLDIFPFNLVQKASCEGQQQILGLYLDLELGLEGRDRRPEHLRVSLRVLQLELRELRETLLEGRDASHPQRLQLLLGLLGDLLEPLARLLLGVLREGDVAVPRSRLVQVLVRVLVVRQTPKYFDF